VDRKFMAMPPHSRFASSPCEAVERIAVVCDCWLFTPRQRRNRMKRGKSRLITAKNNIDRSAPTCRPQSATFYSLIIARNIGRRLPAYSSALEDAGLRKRSAIGEKAGRWARRCNMQDRLALFSIAGFFRPAHSAATCCSRSSQPSA
jgi:hypothetical protein